MEETAAKTKRPSRDGFFAVDGRKWEVACSLGMAPAVAYVVLARGTDSQQRFTPWSRNAIEKYTGISRGKAKAALLALENANLIRPVKPGTRHAYEIMDATQVEECAPWLSHDEARTGADPDKNPQLIWLPNALVTGAAGEVPPLEICRQTGLKDVLRLLILLYQDHDIADSFGIPRAHISQTFSGGELAEYGPFRIYGFYEAKLFKSERAPFAVPFLGGNPVPAGRGNEMWAEAAWYHFTGAWNELRRLGLIEVIPHLVEAEEADGEFIHPMGTGQGTKEENALGAAASDLARAMLTPGQAEQVAAATILAPIPAHRGEVGMVGVFRLKYRPKTSQTRRWAARMPEWAALAQRYRDLAAKTREHVLYERGWATG